MLDHKKILDQMLRAEEAALLEKEEKIKHLPQGYLVQQESMKGSRLYWAEPIYANGIAKDQYHRLRDNDYEIAKAVQEKFLLRKQLPILRSNVGYLKNLSEHYIPCDEASIINQLEEPYISLAGLKSTKKLYPPTKSENPAYPDRLIFRNLRGEYFRSKSEVLISEILYAMGIPYHYEKHLTIDGETKYPDFTILRGSSEKDKYIEYFGMMDKDDYFLHNKEKINWYLNHQIIPGDRILFFYENSKSGLDTILVRKQLEAFLSA